MHPFPSINQFRNVVAHVRRQAAFMGLDGDGNAILNPAPKYPTLLFNGTVKLHGTNAAIVSSPDGITFQSRERVLTRVADNAGFMAHMEQHMGAVCGLFATIARIFGLQGDNNTIAVYGEWCGGNIQKGVAITGLPKMFVIFAIKIDGWWVNVPSTLRVDSASIYNINMFSSWTIAVDFEHPEIAQNSLIELTNRVEACCPVGKALGVEGIGEGIVWRCVSNPSSEFWFKVKGEKHSTSKVKVLAEVDLAVVALVDEFVTMTVTEARLEQGLQNLINEQLKPFDMTSIGDFIRWVHQDVLKEESDILQASGIEYKKLGGPIAQVAKRWFVAKLNEDTFKQVA